MNIVLRSLIITLVVSVLFGAGFSVVFETTLLKPIVACFMIQILFFMLYNNIVSRMTDVAMEKELTAQVEQIANQSVDLSCAYCNTVNNTPIKVNIDNMFNCDECGELNAVYISLTTAQKTKPLDVDRLRVSTLIEEEMKVKKRFLDGQHKI